MAKTPLNITSEKSFTVEGVATRTLSRKFGKPEDYVELHIYDGGNRLLYSEENFQDFNFPSTVTNELSTELNMDPVQVLQDRGYTSGRYKLSFNIPSFSFPMP